MKWQLISVYIIGAICGLYIIYRIFRSIRKVKKGENMCDNCNADCALKNAQSRKNTTTQKRK